MRQIIEWRTDEINESELEHGQCCLFFFNADESLHLFSLDKSDGDEFSCWIDPYTLNFVEQHLFTDPAGFRWALIDSPAEEKIDSKHFEISTHGFLPAMVYEFRNGRIYTHYNSNYYSKEVWHEITKWTRKQVDKHEFDDPSGEKRPTIYVNLRLLFTVPTDSELHRLLS